jgi:alkylated DNA nucleotide flippase Atl1
MTEHTKTCRKCGEAKPLVAFAGRQNTCIQCRDAAKARSIERKEHIAFTPALAEKICDLVSMGSTITEIAAMAGMPTARQIVAWRRRHEEFRDAYEQARVARADARSDRVDEALRDLRNGKISAADCRAIVETELKLAALENPGRYNPATKVQQEVSGPGGAPLAVQVVDDASLIKAARWVADLLSKADEVPVIDLKPEPAAKEAA